MGAEQLTMTERGFSMSETTPTMNYRHMTLGEVIDYLRAVPEYSMVSGLDNATDSYRGYYERIAINRGDWVRARSLADDLAEKIGKTMIGYKGGEFPITEQTLVHVADYGYTGPMLVGFILDSDSGDITPVLVEERW